jgi:predicted HTH domain antitoxin
VRIDLPDVLGIENLSPSELRLELACALYARGKIGKVAGADLAGIDFFTFQKALGERNISSYTESILNQDLENLKAIFPN